MSPQTHNPAMNTIVLDATAHDAADQACQGDSDWQVAERVYLNRLATYAVKQHLQSFGWIAQTPATLPETMILKMLLDSAELILPELGSIECRRVLPDSNTVQIPEEVWSDRIAFIAVRLDENLEQAEILGFIDRVQTSDLPIAQLRSLKDLPAYLQSCRPARSSSITVLSDWLTAQVSSRWQQIQDLVGINEYQWISAFRSKSKDAFRTATPASEVYGGSLAIGLGDHTVTLLTLVSPCSDTDLWIQMTLLPIADQSFLPANLQFSVLDDQEDTVIDIQTKPDHERLQVSFEGELGDLFSVKLQLEHSTAQEFFLV